MRTTVGQQTGAATDLTWLVDDLVNRVAEVRHAVVLSADGLRITSSGGIDRDDAEHLSAVASGLQSLARGVGTRFDTGEVRQTIVEMDDGFLFVTAAGHGACLAVLGTAEVDVGLVAYEMAMLVTRAGQYLATRTRLGADQPAGG
jgi:predicted regulator of Ras-like GTPase activity (Roadblock/LC7/MglB family)